MDFIMENPILWGSIFVVLLIAIIVVISIIVSKHRRKEVEEIEKMFPSGNMTSEDIKISVERVRRKERGSQKHRKKRIHRERPREAHPDEDKEIVRRDAKQDQDSSLSEENETKEETVSVATQAKTTDKITRQRDLEPEPKEEKEQPPKEKGFSRKPGKMLKSDLLSKTINRHKIEKGDYKSSRGHSLLQQTMDQEEEKGEAPAGKQKAQSLPTKSQSEQTGKGRQDKEEQGAIDKATSRRLFKRSLLKADKEAKTDSDKLPKASLIDTQMFSGKEEEQEQDETEANLPPRQKRVNKKSFFSKRK